MNCYFNWYLFQLIVLLNPDFNCCSNFVLPWVDEVTKAAWSFVYVMAKAGSLSPSEGAQFSDQVRIRLISQLSKGTSRVLQKLLKYFNGTAIFAFIILALLILSKDFYSNLNNWVDKRCTIFKYPLFIISICGYCYGVCTCSNNSYSSTHKDIYITVIT